MMDPSAISAPVEELLHSMTSVTGHKLIFLSSTQGSRPARFTWPVMADDGDLHGQLHVITEEEVIVETHQRLYTQLSRIIAHDIDLRARALSLEQRFRLLDQQNSELTALNRALSEMAYRDPLTRLYQRWYLLEQLQLELSRASRYGKDFSCILIDIDALRTVNEDSGTRGGDTLLSRLARVLEQCCRTSDLVARFGGDEFGILLTDTPLEGAVQLAERIRQRWMFERGKDLAPLSLSIAVGAARTESGGFIDDADRLLESLDQAIARVKAAGGDRVEICSAMLDAREAPAQ